MQIEAAMSALDLRGAFSKLPHACVCTTGTLACFVKTQSMYGRTCSMQVMVGEEDGKVGREARF